MKKIMIYSMTFFLAFFLAGISDTLAKKGEPRIKYKRVVVHKPIKGRVVYHRPVVVRSGLFLFSLIFHGSYLPK